MNSPAPSPIQLLTQLTSKISPLALLPALLGGAVAAGYGVWFLYEVITSSVGRGGYQYAVELPSVPATQVQSAPFCAQKTTKWIGCY